MVGTSNQSVPEMAIETCFLCRGSLDGGSIRDWLFPWPQKPTRTNTCHSKAGANSMSNITPFPCVTKRLHHLML